MDEVEVIINCLSSYDIKYIECAYLLNEIR